MTQAHLAGYKFQTLQNLETKKRDLLDFCGRRSLKGKVLMSEEGINFFVSGSEADIDDFKHFLQLGLHIESPLMRLTYCSLPAYRRLLVKIKREIIPFGFDNISPACEPAPYIEPKVLRDWYNEGRPFVILDTRNEYEVKLGKFKGALHFPIKHFRDFKQVETDLKKLPPEAPIVTYCTGGIRCEKAAPFLIEKGFPQVFQLQGGILKYFEDCGGDFFEGNCFVFDRRVSLNSSLEPTDDKVCFVCLEPLTPKEWQDRRYVEGVSCPYCFTTDRMPHSS